MIICNTLFSSCASIYSTLLAATPPPPSSRPTPAVVPRRSGPTVPAVSSPLRSCPPFDYVIPRAPSPASNPLIIFTRRSDSPAPGGPIPFTFHYELAAIPPIEPAAFFSSRFCRGHLHPCRLVSVLPDRRRSLHSVTERVVLRLSLSLPMSNPRCRCMCGPRRLPDGSGISEFPCAC